MIAMEDVKEKEHRHLESETLRDRRLRLMSLPAAARLSALLQSPDAEDLVADLPDQDFFYFVKELGPDDSLPLLALGRFSQLMHLFDLEWWQGDQIQPARALEWLKRLASAGEEKLLGWLYEADYELLVTLFKKAIRVVALPDDADIVEVRDQMPPNTLDDQYFWESNYPQFEEFLGRLLALVFEVHSGFYRELMTHVIWGSAVELEEDAFRFHQGRLADRAIPELAEALAIYRSITPGEILREGGAKTALRSTDEPSRGPSLALTLLPGEDLLGQALRQIKDPEILDALLLELAALGNKVVVADRLPGDEPESLRHAMNKVSACVNLGLLRLTGGDLAASLRVLGEVFLEELFRLGHSQTIPVRNRAERLVKRGWLAEWKAGPGCLDGVWEEALEFLLERTPRILRPLLGRHEAPREDFIRTRRDLAQAGWVVEVLEALGVLLGHLQIAPGALDTHRLWSQGQIRRVEDLTIGVLIFTGAAQLASSGVWRMEPLAVDAWAGIFPLVQPSSLHAVIRDVAARTPADERQKKRMWAYLDWLMREYAEEMQAFSSRNVPDPRLVRHFVFSQQ